MADPQLLRRESMSHLAWGTLLLATCLATYIIYAQAFGALWTFDDSRVLEGINRVDSIRSAIAYAFHDNTVGILRRPLAMASFLLNPGDWPLHPSGYRHVNTLIHILNGLLLALIAIRVARAVPRLENHAAGFGTTLAIVWMLQPLLASTSLMIVQRMTLLAGTFSLLGSLIYLHGRECFPHQPGKAYIWMGTGLILATVLGVLTKENAVLTPLLVGCLEYAVLSVYTPICHPHLSRWRIVFFGLPALGIALYGGYYCVSHLADSYSIRPFTLGQRVLSETLILFDYVRQIIMPDITSMGPFQDDISRIHGVEPLTIAASVAWLALLYIGVVFRRKLPAVSFAVFFFLTGQLIESSLFPLELYFEHRNYLPSIGILGPLVALAWVPQQRWPKILPLVFAAAMGPLLWQYTTLWAKPMASAKAWAEAHPTSTRAVANLASQYQMNGNTKTAAQIVVGNYKLKPRDGGLALMAVVAQCFSSTPDRVMIAQVTQEAPYLYNTVGASFNVHKIIDLHLLGACDTIKPEWIIGIAQGLLQNPGYQGNTLLHYDLLIALARAYGLSGDNMQSIKAKLVAFRIRPQIDDASDIFKGLLASGHFQEAHAFLAEARHCIPGYAEVFASWENDLTAQQIRQHH